jgi:hypothetical protein
VRVVAAVDDQVLFERRPPYVEAPDGGDVAAGLTYGGGEAAQRARSVVEADPETDRVGSGRGRHGSTVAARSVATVNAKPSVGAAPPPVVGCETEGSTIDVASGRDAPS